MPNAEILSLRNNTSKGCRDQNAFVFQLKFLYKRNASIVINCWIWFNINRYTVNILLFHCLGKFKMPLLLTNQFSVSRSDVLIVKLFALHSVFTRHTYTSLHFIHHIYTSLYFAHHKFFAIFYHWIKKN